MDNLRAAWAWGITRGKFEAIGRAVRSFGWFYEVAGMIRDGIEQLELIVQALSDQPRHIQMDRVLGTSLVQQGLLFFHSGQFARAQELYNRSIDIHIEVPGVDYEKLSGDRLGETSQAIRARVQAARDRQRERFSNLDAKHPIFCNADMCVGEIRQFCRLQEEGQRLMRAAMSQLNLSARAYHHILKLARTIADLAEALRYRPKLMLG